MDRRSFVAALSAAPLVGCFNRPVIIDRPGVQLYTVRDAMLEDTSGTLAALAEIGCLDVEMAGTYGMTSSSFRRHLDASGLRAVSGHADFVEVRGDWQRTLDDAAELGHELIVVPWLPEDVRTADGYRAVADDLNRAGEAAQRMGIRFGYHNHQFEFDAMDGVIPMALLLDETDGSLVDWQMDIYWVVDGGHEPLEWLDRYSARVTSVHIKDRSAQGAMVDVGDGVIDFEKILSAAKAHELRHSFIEHDNPADSLVTVRRSFDYLMQEFAQ